MAGIDIKYLNAKVKINFYQNENLITSNYLQKDEIIYSGKGEDLKPKINFSLHSSRIPILTEGNYDVKIFFEDNIFNNIFIKEISPSKTELRIGLSNELSNKWTLWCYKPKLLVEDFNSFITIDNNKFRIINVIPDYSKVNEDLVELQKQIEETKDKEELEKLINKKNILCGNVTFILKIDNAINFNIDLPYENKYTYLNREIYQTIEYNDVYIYSSNNEISPVFNLSNESNFDLENFYNTGGKTYTDLVGSYSSSLFSFISSSLKSGIETLNIDYSDISAFNYFGSFETKLQNVYNKIKKIEDNNILITSYNSGSRSETSSSINYYNKKNREIIDTFSLYEKYAYEQSGSYAWPKNINNINYSYSSSQVITWFSSSTDDAKTYDNNNNNILIRNVPENIIINDKSKNLVNLLYAWGDFFDEIKCYIDQIPYFWNIDYDNINSVPDDLLGSLGNILQQPLYEGYDKEVLNTFALGEGLTTGSIQLKEATREKWKRLLDNLPYLNKIRGTKRSIDALLNIYGIPSSILRIKEYGGGNKATGSAYIQENKNTYVLNIAGNEYLRMPTNSYNQIIGNDFTIEMRFKNDSYLNMDLFGNDGFTVSLITGSSDSGSLKLNTNDESININWSNVWYNNWNYVYLIRSGNNIKLGIKQYKENQLFIDLSGSDIIVDNNNFNPGVTAGNYIYFGSGSFSGSMQEIRLWTTALSDAELNNHAYDFESIAMENYGDVNSYLAGHWKLNDNRNLNTDAYVNDYNRTVNKYDMDAYNFIDNTFINTTINDNILYLTNFNPQLYSDNKINIGYIHSSSQVQNSNRVDLMFSPADYINHDILNEFSMIDFNDAIGNPLDMYKENYSTLDTWRKYYFSKFSSNYNFFAFIKFIQNFDDSVFKIVNDLLPERVILKKGLVIRPNILERSKYKWHEPSISTHHYSSSYEINPTLEEELDECPEGTLENTGSVTAEYSLFDTSYIYEPSSSYGTITEMYTPGTKNIIPEILDKICYVGSMNNISNDYHGAPVMISQSSGTIIRVA